MKMTAVYDDGGRILAAIIDDGKYDGPRPVADDKTHSGTFEVPAEAARLSLEELCTTYRIDPSASQLTRRKG
jgi:hypothetical protein